MPEAQLSAEAAGALAHRPQTNACPSWRLTMAVITKQQSKTVRTSAQVQLNAAGLRMASHIGQRFLHQSIEMKLVLYGQNRNWSSELEPALDSQRALPLLDKLGEQKLRSISYGYPTKPCNDSWMMRMLNVWPTMPTLGWSEPRRKRK